MTHEAGIEAAFARMEEISDYPDFNIVDVPSVIQAYVSASGMVLVPREPDEAILDKMNTGFWFDQDDARQVWVGLVNAAPDPFKSKPGE